MVDGWSCPGCETPDQMLGGIAGSAAVRNVVRTATREGTRELSTTEPGASDGAANVHSDSGAAGSGGSRDAAADAPRDSARSIDGAVDSGAGGDASVDASQGSACPGATIPGPLPAVFNCSSRGSTCESAWWIWLAARLYVPLARTIKLKSDCLALLSCVGQLDFSCVLMSPPGGGIVLLLFGYLLLSRSQRFLCEAISSGRGNYRFRRGVEADSGSFYHPPSPPPGGSEVFGGGRVRHVLRLRVNLAARRAFQDPPGDSLFVALLLPASGAVTRKRTTRA